MPPEKHDEVKDSIMSWSFDDDQGYILDVDLHCPPEQHVKLKEYPPAPDKREITYNDLSETNKIIHQEIFGVGKRNYKGQKLVASLEDKDNYVVHGMALQMYLKLGLKIKQVNKIITFNQKPFCAPFVQLCAKYRSEAADEGSSLRQRLFKNIPNATYGKTVQRARNLRKLFHMFLSEKKN